MSMTFRAPVVRGFQGGHEFYIGSISAGMLVQLVRFTDPSLPVRDRAQRIVSVPDAKSISDYITANLGSYKFNNIELSIMGNARFEPIEADSTFGYLVWDEKTPVLCNDGQTRSKGYEFAIAINSAIAHGQDVKVAFEVNPSLERCRQVFADLNLKRRKVSTGLSKYFDSRDPELRIARELVESMPLLANLTTIEKDSLNKNDPYLFTFNGWVEATSHLLCGQEDLSIEDQIALASEYWSAIAIYISDWLAVNERSKTAVQVRAESLHCQAVMLVAIGRLGAFLLTRYPKAWQEKLQTLRQVDWARHNTAWRGRVIVDGALKKTKKAEVGALSYLKTCMGLTLNADEQAFEDWLRKNL